MAKTYYLHEEVSKMGKKLGNLTGWRSDIAKVLLASKVEDDTAVNQIRHILAKLAVGGDQSLIDETILLLPRSIRNKAKILAHHLLEKSKIHIGGNGQVVYPDETEGGSFIDHLKYFCSSSSMKVAAPFDMEKMKQLLKDTNAPITSVRASSSTRTNAWISL